ncbi:MAG: sensor histidine kinase [Pelagibaca sp.]
MDNTETDQFSERDLRVQFSLVLVKYATPFALLWWCAAFFLNAKLLTVAATITLAGFIAGILLHHADRHMTARVVWLGSANIGVALGAFVTPPEARVSFIFVAIATAPFVVFSIQSELSRLLLMTAIPVALWVFAWSTNYSLLGEFEISRAEAAMVLAPITAFTVFGTVLFVIGYFVRRTQRNAALLQEAQREAQRSSDSKSALMRSVSHEMLTPLHAISGFAEFLNADAKSGRTVDQATLDTYSDQIMRSSNALLLIIENIFDFANWKDDGNLTDTSHVSITDGLNPVVTRFTAELSSKKLELDTRIDPDLRVQANPVWLASIFKQLLDNAIKFSPVGGTIGIQALPVGEDQVEIVFRDSGPGFPEGTAEEAFVAFERLGHETGTTSGVGVGLSLAQKFAEAMGGRISIDETLRSGAKVSLVLPRSLPE